jgi:hypothetical protein
MGIGIVAGCSTGHLTQQVSTRSLAADLGEVGVVAVTRTGRERTQALATLLQLFSQFRSTAETIPEPTEKHQ